MVTVVLPVYNERDNLAPLLAEIAASLAAIPHETVAVDDGSTDGSLEVLQALRGTHPGLRIVALARNAGQSAAIAAGFAAARVDVVVTMDADGQNDPADVPRLLAALDDPTHPAAAVGFRPRRMDSAWRRLQSRVANGCRNLLTDDGIRDIGCSLKAMRVGAVTALPHFDGMHRFLPALIRLGGGLVVEVAVGHRPRRTGRSKYGMWNRAWRGLVDALGVRWLHRRRLDYVVREEIG